MSYQHLTTNERGRIQELHSLGYSNRKIAERLGRHHSTIDRELNRNRGATSYCGEKAQERYHQRRSTAAQKTKCTPTRALTISQKLRETWSPEQISHTIMKGQVSTKSIYRWIYHGLLPRISPKNLRHKGKRRKAEKRGKFAMGTPISMRPKEVKNREVFGHWELDSMVSSRGESKGCFATFVERKSRFYIAVKTPDRTAASMHYAITELFKRLPTGTFKTATTDRGKEFACHEEIKKELGLTLFFADAYCSWQRGSNENSNGLLREFYPKKTNLLLVNSHELNHNLFLINSRPRKCLGWYSAFQVFLANLAHFS